MRRSVRIAAACLSLFAAGRASRSLANNAFLNQEFVVISLTEKKNDREAFLLDCATVESFGGIPLARRGALQFYRMGRSDAEESTNQLGRPLLGHPSFSSVQLRNRTVTPSISLESVESHKWILQFAIPPAPSDLEAVSDTGVRILEPLPPNGYLVWADDQQAVGRILELARDEARMIQTFVPLEISDNICSSLDPVLNAPVSSRASTEPVWVDVTLYETGEATEADAATLTQLGTNHRSGPLALPGLRTYRIQATHGANTIAEIALLPSLAIVERAQGFELLGESNAMIVLNRTEIDTGGPVDFERPTGATYLDDLSSVLGSDETGGFPCREWSENYPVVGVFDNGIDNGTTTTVSADFYVGGDSGNPSRIVDGFSVDPGPPEQLDDTSTTIAARTLLDEDYSHGHAAASVLGGYNNLANVSGASYEDSGFFNHGLGVNPYGRISNVFNYYRPLLGVEDGDNEVYWGRRVHWFWKRSWELVNTVPSAEESTRFVDRTLISSNS